MREADMLGTRFGLATSFVTLGVAASAAVVLSARFWPAIDPVELKTRINARI